MGRFDSAPRFQAMSYATPTDFRALGLPAAAVEELDDAQIQAHLTSCAGVIDSYLGARYALPLVAPFPAVLVRIEVDLAVCSVLLWRGYNPETFDTLYAERCKAAKAWLESVAAGRVSVPGAQDSSAGVNDGAPRAVTASRLWGGGGCCGW